jgi:hypothetical protein
MAHRVFGAQYMIVLIYFSAYNGVRVGWEFTVLTANYRTAAKITDLLLSFALCGIGRALLSVCIRKNIRPFCSNEAVSHLFGVFICFLPSWRENDLRSCESSHYVGNKWCAARTERTEELLRSTGNDSHKIASSVPHAVEQLSSRRHGLRCTHVRVGVCQTRVTCRYETLPSAFLGVLSSFATDGSYFKILHLEMWPVQLLTCAIALHVTMILNIFISLWLKVVSCQLLASCLGCTVRC